MEKETKSMDRFSSSMAEVGIFSGYPDVVDIEQMSEMLGISTKTAYKLLKDNKIKHFKIGRTYKIPKQSVIYFINVA